MLKFTDDALATKLGSIIRLGEVSSVNDDHTDNYFSEKRPRFPAIEEDCEMLYPLVGDYGTL